MSYRLREREPLSARVTVEIDSVLFRGEQGRFHIETRGEMTCDAGHYHVRNTVSVCEGGSSGGDGVGEREVFSRAWERRVPRDLT